MPDRTNRSDDDLIENRRALSRLKWLMTIVPAVAVFLYETVRHDLLSRVLSTASGNLIAGLLALVLAYIFSDVILGIVERLQAEAMARSREIVALNATVQERERLSHELHDGLAQVVAYLLIRIDTVGGLVETGRRREAMAELQRLRDVADDLYADIRESISGLRTRITDQGLRAALQEYLEGFEEQHGIIVDFQSEGVPEDLPPLVEMQLFRIVQEALANIRKHAHARHVSVAATLFGPETLTVVVGDDGQGFDPAAADVPGRNSFGLMMMRERAASLGGTLSVESEPGRGTRVIATVPFAGRIKEADATLATTAR